MLTQPIHVGGVGVANLRFFAPVIGKRHFAWVSLSDLLTCLSQSADFQLIFTRSVSEAEFEEDARTVAIDGVLTLIVPHHAAQGIIEAELTLGRFGAGLRMQYDIESANAIAVLTAGMGSEECFSYLAEARRHAGEYPQ